MKEGKQIRIEGERVAYYQGGVQKTRTVGETVERKEECLRKKKEGKRKIRGPLLLVKKGKKKNSHKFTIKRKISLFSVKG